VCRFNVKFTVARAEKHAKILLAGKLAVANWMFAAAIVIKINEIGET
jgi:hypothetical protein